MNSRQMKRSQQCYRKNDLIAACYQATDDYKWPGVSPGLVSFVLVSLQDCFI